MKKRTQALWLTLILIPALPGWTTAKDRLPLGYSSASGVFAGLWVGQEGKIFEKYDIDSHLVLIASGSLMVQAMLGGDLPIAGAAGSAAVDASLGGADIVMFGSMVKVPAFYIMALPEIKTIEDLRGKSVGVTHFGSSTDFTMRYVLRKQGLEPGKDVTLIQTGDIFAAATPAPRGWFRPARDAFWSVLREASGELETFAARRGHTLLELALGWLLRDGVVASVIAGATTPEQVEQNVRAAGWTLSPEDLAEIDRITQ